MLCYVDSIVLCNVVYSQSTRTKHATSLGVVSSVVSSVVSIVVSSVVSSLVVCIFSFYNFLGLVYISFNYYPISNRILFANCTKIKTNED